jgi:RecA-family ATPase
LGLTRDLIVIDTLNRNFGGGDENSAQDMGQFIENLDEAQRHLGRRNSWYITRTRAASESEAERLYAEPAAQPSASRRTVPAEQR